MHMSTPHAQVVFHQEFPTIIMSTRLPDNFLSLLTTVTDRLFGNTAMTASLDYSKGTTTRGGSQVILFGDEHNKHREYQDTEWQAGKDLFMQYLASLSRHYAFNLIRTCAPWFGRTPEDRYQVIPRNVWALSQFEHDYNSMHVHPGTNVSGVVYLKVPEQVNKANEPDGCISFWSNQPYDPINLQFGGNRTIVPKPGDVFLFPAWLPHTVYPFRGPGERRIVSFNWIVMPDPQSINKPGSANSIVNSGNP
ncbi:MAG: hypothetical protein Tsb0026_01260 [Sulfuricaulis sp.]